MSTEAVNIHEKPKRRRNITKDMPFLPGLITSLLRLIHRTCRLSILGREHLEAARDRRESDILAFWHFAFPTILHQFQGHGFLTIISRSRDGELASAIAEKMGYTIFRGSPGKGGVSALKALISAFRNARGAGFVVDGSQGPAQVAQKGILVLAQYSGAPILPVSMAANPCWRFRSWDRTVLAKPFSRVVLACGAPIRVERGASAERLEEYRLELETSLNDLSRAAEDAVSGRVAQNIESVKMGWIQDLIRIKKSDPEQGR